MATNDGINPNSVTTIGEWAFYKNSTSNSNPNLASIAIDKTCSVIKSMSNYAWLGNNVGTTIYGSNNEVCNAW